MEVESEELEDLPLFQQQVDQSNSTIVDVERGHVSVNTTLEETDKAVNTNLLIEETMFLVANVTELSENHYSLIKNAGKLLIYLVKIS